MRMITLAFLLGGVIVALATGSTAAVTRVLPRIPPGTVVGDHATAGWNRLVLLARPRLASGDLDKVPSLAKKYATKFNLTIMASVDEEKNKATTQFTLQEVGVGYSLPIQERDVVISSDTQRRLGAKLGLVGRQVLTSSEKCLQDVLEVARLPTLSIFDAKAIVLRDGQHRDMVVRHMVWVHSRTGKIGTLIWLLQEDKDHGYRMAGEVAQALPAGFVEDREIHVKASEFILGLPSKRAFALVRMPQGQALRVTPRLAEMAASGSFTEPSARALASAFSRALKR